MAMWDGCEPLGPEGGLWVDNGMLSIKKAIYIIPGNCECHLIWKGPFLCD